MTPFIRAVLSNLVGDEEASKIAVVANDAKIYPDGKWEIKYRHPTRQVPSVLSYGKGDTDVRTHTIQWLRTRQEPSDPALPRPPEPPYRILLR